MSNTLTISAVAPELYKAMDIVARELSGAIPSVMINSGSEGASINDTVKSFRTAQPTLNTSVTPAMTIPATDDQTLASETMTLNKIANVNIPINGETFKALNNGVGGEAVRVSLFAQAIRKAINAIEAEVCTTIYKGASRATGTAGTTPFASNFNILADLRKILVDNGTPFDGRNSVVFNTSAGVKLRQLAALYNVHSAGTSDVLRNGQLIDLMGFSIKESAGIQAHTKGAGTGYDINNGAGEVAGETTLTLDGGTVNTTGIKAGDIVTFAGDTSEQGGVSKYVVKTGSTATGGDIVINYPGLLATLADTVEMTIGDSYTANFGLHQSAVELAMRAPAQPFGGDAATDRLLLRDEATGLVFDFAQYKGYMMNRWDLTVYYGVKVWKPEFVAILLG